MEVLSLSKSNKKNILSLLAGIATDEGKLDLHDIHKKTIHAIGHHLLGIDESDDILSNTFSVSESFTSKDVQSEILHLAGPLVFLEEAHQLQRSMAMERLAKKWKLKDKLVKTIIKTAEGKKLAILMCEVRPTEVEVGASSLKQAYGYLMGKLGLDHNKELYDMYKGYESLPENSLGKTLSTYYKQNQFLIPGEGGAPLVDILVIHDFHHVLSGYDTTPLGELCVLAFDNGISKNDYAGILTGVTAQFQIGVTIDTTTNTWVNQFDPEAIYRAYRRGLDCNTNYIDNKYDFNLIADQSLSEIRKKFNISEEGMFINSSKDKWCGKYGPPALRKNKNIVKEGKAL